MPTYSCMGCDCDLRNKAPARIKYIWLNKTYGWIIMCTELCECWGCWPIRKFKTWNLHHTGNKKLLTCCSVCNGLLKNIEIIICAWKNCGWVRVLKPAPTVTLLNEECSVICTIIKLRCCTALYFGGKFQLSLSRYVYCAFLRWCWTGTGPEIPERRDRYGGGWIPTKPVLLVLVVDKQLNLWTKQNWCRSF